VKEVSRALGVSAAHIYVNKHRISLRLKNALKELATKERDRGA